MIGPLVQGGLLDSRRRAANATIVDVFDDLSDSISVGREVVVTRRRV